MWSCIPGIWLKAYIKIVISQRMPTYSHSKLSTFEQCKLKYKFQGIDKIEVAQMSVKEFTEDEGVQMADEYGELDKEEKEITARNEDSRERLILYAQQKNVEAAFGGSHKVSVKPFEKIDCPYVSTGIGESHKTIRSYSTSRLHHSSISRRV